jgi:6-methylsalicylate decarboxylase
VGVTLGASVAGRKLDDPVFAELDQRGSVVFLHPVGQDDTPWLAGHDLAWLAGAPFEDTAVALRLILAGMAARFPAFASSSPTWAERSRSGWPGVTRKSTAEITSGLRSMYYDTVSRSPDALTSACRAFGGRQESPAAHA